MKHISQQEFNTEKKIVIDGRFFTDRLTGVQRTAWEIVNALSKRNDVKLIIALPKNANADLANFNNSVVEYVGKYKNNLWEQVSLVRYCKKKKLPLLCLCNLAPVFYKSYVVLHDLRIQDSKEYDNKKFRFKFKALVRLYAYKAKKIFTVSEFSKERMLYHYPRLKNNMPIVITNGYEHINRLGEKEIEGLPSEFFLTVGSDLRHKNFEYILHLAKNNPSKFFVITGKQNTCYQKFTTETNLKNCFFTGYVSNEQLKWLYNRCEGFILPSLYEGFGIPPLEAVAAGCTKIYLSDIPVFREIYGDTANYFDPLDYENTVKLEEGKSVSDLEKAALLEKYSWKNAAEIIMNSIFPQATVSND